MIMAAKLLIPKKTMSGMQTKRNKKRILFSFHERFLNFSENIGISATNNHDVSKTKISK